MPSQLYYVLDETNEPIGVLKFDDAKLVTTAYPKLGDVLKGQRKEAVEHLLLPLRWSLQTPKDYREDRG